MMNSKGISGVMVAVLLTIIGIAAVLVFGNMIISFVSPRQLKGQIDSAQIIVVGKKAKLAVSISNVGTIDFKVNSIKVDGNEVNCEPEFEIISPGASVSYTCECQANVGDTKIIEVEITSTGGQKSVLLSSAYARRG